MVKFLEDDRSTPMAETSAPSPSSSPISTITTFAPLRPAHLQRKSRPFKRDHAHFHHQHPDPFSGVNLIHIHNVHNPPVHYFVHHHHCPFPPPQCAELCSAEAPPRVPGGGAMGSNEQAPARFYFGPGFEPQRGGFFEPPGRPQGRKREEYVVNFHVNPGVNVNLMMRDGSVEILRGPVTVPMVSTNQTPPIPMPVHVPHGHVVQQIVDENGTLRHVILSPSQHSNLVPLQNTNHYKCLTGHQIRSSRKEQRSEKEEIYRHPV